MRSLLALFALISTCASAQTPLVKILSDELDRNFTVLKQKGNPAPYFMSYEVTSTDTYALVASRGSLETQQHNQTRYLDVTIRDGTPAVRQLSPGGERKPSPLHRRLADRAGG